MPLSPWPIRRRWKLLLCRSRTDKCRRSRGAAPTWRAVSDPLPMATRMGIPWTPNFALVAGAWSTFTRTSLHLPANSAANYSRRGPTVRQGPHHGAQKSTMTGVVVRSAISANMASSASAIQGRADLHRAQRGTPAAADGTLFW